MTKVPCTIAFTLDEGRAELQPRESEHHYDRRAQYDMALAKIEEVMQHICNILQLLLIPSCSSYAPTLSLQGVFVKVAESESRENYLSGYIFLLESSNKVEFSRELPRLLEAFGAQAVPMGEYAHHSQDYCWGIHEMTVENLKKKSKPAYNANKMVLSIVNEQYSSGICNFTILKYAFFDNVKMNI
ncbi:hypothetical protein Tco_0025302 [Tanacetum coccineum]